MYAVILKKDETSWDVLKVLGPNSNLERQLLIENAVSKNIPLVGMETTSFRDSLRIGSVWDGVSFSGGVQRPEDSEPIDIWDNYKRFSFLSENTVVLNFTINKNSSVSDYMSESFKKEVTLVEIPTDQSVSPGETHGWNGSRFI